MSWAPPPATNAQEPVAPSPAPARPAPLPELPPWPLTDFGPPPARPKHDPVARAWFFALLIGLTLTTLHLFQAFASDILIAILIAGVLRPVQHTLERYMRPWVAAGLTCALVLVMLVGPIVYLAIALSAEAAALVDVARHSVTMDKVNAFVFGDGAVATYARKLAGTFGVSYTPESVKALLGGAVSGVAKFLYAQANSIISNLLVLVFHLALCMLCLYYLLIDGARFRTFLLETSPLPDEEDEAILERFQSVGRAILWGNGAGSVIQGFIGGILMALVGLPSPIMWGTVMAFAAFLPMIGISIVYIPAAIYLIIEGRLVAAIGFAIACFMLSMVFENVVKTKMIGSSLRMHDAVILLSILAGMGVFGLLGLLYGPMVVALFLAVLELYQRKYKAELAR